VNGYKKIMARNEFTSIFLPGMPVPEPPDWRPFLYMIFQGFMILVFVLFIGFLVYETVMDVVGKPIWLNGVELAKRQTTPPTKEEIAAQFSLISPLPNSRLNQRLVTIICVWNPDPFTQLKSSGGELLPSYEPELFVDGRQVNWTTRYGTSWFVQVELRAGLHNLWVANLGTEFIIDLPANAGLAGESSAKSSERQTKIDTTANDRQTDYDFKIKKALFPVVRSHPFVDDAGKCNTCHEIITGKPNPAATSQRPILRPVNNSSACVDCHDKNKIHSAHGNRLDIWENCSKCHILHGTTTNVKGLLRRDIMP
jgi:hypothetical protein